MIFLDTFCDSAPAEEMIPTLSVTVVILRTFSICKTTENATRPLETSLELFHEPDFDWFKKLENFYIPGGL